MFPLWMMALHLIYSRLGLREKSLPEEYHRTNAATIRSP